MACCQETQPVVHQNVKEYYGKRVQTSQDLMTSCCTVNRDTFSSEAKEAFKLIHPEILSKNYGCGAVYPEAVTDCKVLDLGSGAGLDCFVLSKLVGPEGHVTGIDMTTEQLEVARKHVDFHTQAFGYSKLNVEFREGYIEKLADAGLKDATFDVIVSNCVINLSPNKGDVLREAYRVLKDGGEMYFSDIYSNMAVPKALKENKVLWGECLSGAMQWTELMKLATEIGFAPPVLVSSSLYTSDNPKLKEMLEAAGCPELQFCSATYRLIKVASSQGHDPQEGLVAVQYKGTISGQLSVFGFSFHGQLKVDSPTILPSSVAHLIQFCPRLSPHFTFTPLSPDQAETTPMIPPLAKFVDINPFEVSTKSTELAPPKFSDNEDCFGLPPAKKPCCTPTKEPCCGISSDTPTKEPCCGTSSDTPTKEPCCGTSSDTPTKEPCCGTSSTPTKEHPPTCSN